LIVPSVEASLINLKAVKEYSEQDDARNNFLTDDSSVLESDYDVTSPYFESDEPEIFSLEKLVQMSLSQVGKLLQFIPFPLNFSISRSRIKKNLCKTNSSLRRLCKTPRPNR
jgi:hypothetical protein